LGFTTRWRRKALAGFSPGKLIDTGLSCCLLFSGPAEKWGKHCGVDPFAHPERRRRLTEWFDTLPCYKLFMRLYTGNRPGANERRGFLPALDGKRKPGSHAGITILIHRLNTATMDFRSTYTATDFANRAQEYSAHCSAGENELRKQNGRLSNVSREYSEEDTQQIGSEQTDTHETNAAPATA
jgi:hypothetical protein